MSDIITTHTRHVYSVVHSGTPPEAIGVTGRVARSWIRCANDYGLDPAGQGGLQQVSLGELADRQAQLDELFAFARPEMVHLSQQITPSGYVIALTDSDGVMLSSFGDQNLTRSRLVPGSVWSERAQGTNAMGTCLAERVPVVIDHEEHFLAGNIGFTCSAAPIFDAEGQIAAVLDASGTPRTEEQHMLLLVNMAAQRIESRLFLHRFCSDFVLRFHRRPEFVDTVSEGAIAFSATGAVLAANRSALLQLGLRSPQDVRERDISELFRESAQVLVDLPSHHGAHLGSIVEAGRGARFFARIQLPPGGRVRVPITPTRSVRRVAAPVAPRAPLDALESGDALMAENVRRAKRVLDKDIPVLLYGETGTGKEVFARALHLSGPRADKPFVALNCASIPESLIESELFGYKAGAFTGAARDGRRGKVLLANGGTLFLDEVGDMPLQQQARLLRVLEEREVLPLGGDEPVKVDIRLISATHCDLPSKIASGEFRPDLYYRLQGVSFTLPPLRERGDRRDLIVRTLAEEAGDGVHIEIEERAMERLDRYPWPGNLRELRHVMRILAALREDHTVTEGDLPDVVLKGEGPRSAPSATAGAPSDLSPLATAEREALVRELDRQRWNITNVARRLRISRNTLYRKMQRLNIRDPNKKVLH